MSVRTAADERKEDVVEILRGLNLSSLEYNLESMIDSDTWGGDDWTLTFRQKVEKDIERVQKMKRWIREMQKTY